MRIPVCAILLGLAACAHSEPFVAAGPDSLPPASATLPRRLTFNAGDDRHPSVSGGRLAFSRLEPAEASGGRERCLAYLPPEGGTVLSEPCPPVVAQTPADTFVDTWTEPAISPDGRRVAFMWQQGSLIGVLGFYRTFLVVAPVNTPTDAHRFVWEILMALPGYRFGDSVQKIAWMDDSHLRFLICHQYIIKVKGGGLARYTDTTFLPYGLAELDLTSGTAELVAGGDSVSKWAPAPDGGSWVVYPRDSLRVLHLGPSGDTTTVAVFSDSIVDLAPLGGWPVALLAPTATLPTRLEWVDSAGAVPRVLMLGDLVGPARRIAAVPGTRRLVIEVERGDSLFGAPANLWLYEVP